MFKVPFLVVALAACFATSAPQYKIFDLGVARSGDTSSQGARISTNGIATGRTSGTGSSAFKWSLGGTTVAQTNPTSPARSFCYGNGINSLGTIVGVGATTFFGSSRLPVMWQNGTPSYLSLPSGETIGDAWDINDSGLVVGSCDGGSTQQAVLYDNGTATKITATTASGQYWVTAYAVNNSGLVTGQGWDPNNAAWTIGLLHDVNSGVTTSIGALTPLGHNSAIGFDISNAGHVVGTSSLNSGANSLPFIWTQLGGMTQVPLPTGTSQGGARGVNSSGWVVGTASSAFAIPYVYDGTATYRMADLIPSGTGWDLSTNTSSSAMSISEDGSITGTGVKGGAVRAYVAVLKIPVSGTIDLLEFSPSQVGQPVTIEVRDSSNVVVQTENVLLGAAGVVSFDLNPSLRGQTVRVFAKGSHWLRKEVFSGTIGLDGVVFGAASLRNGDVNGDNVIDLTDYTRIAVAFNALPASANWDAPADLNGDEVVDLTDYTIVAVGFNALGD